MAASNMAASGVVVIRYHYYCLEAEALSSDSYKEWLTLVFDDCLSY